MNLTFDYYHNLDGVELYLCNPDETQLFVLQGTDRTLTLRFNDLSELSFTVYSTATDSYGNIIELESYDYVETKRLIYATKIGWFVINNIVEEDDGTTKYKTVTCESYQSIFKYRGVTTEERVYYLYNAADPYDVRYDYHDDGAIPSVVGQLYKQLGIQQDIKEERMSPTTPYSEWTITYISSSLKGGIARNFTENTTFGYDWMINEVEEAFEIAFIFDFMYKTIEILTPDEVTVKSKVIFTFSNFMQSTKIEESTDDLVTVLNASGDGIDITSVNPTGTAYICDFSYYMDDEGKWMSSELKAKLTQWKADVEAQETPYKTKIKSLKTQYNTLANINEQLQEVSLRYTDLDAAVTKKSIAVTEGTTLYGIVMAETVDVGEKSQDKTSPYYSSSFTNSAVLTCYKDQPTFDETTRLWSGTGSSISGTADYCYKYTDSDNNQYHYFIDSSNKTSYCKLNGKAKLNVTTYEYDYTCSGFSRYIDLNITQNWMKVYDTKKANLQSRKTVCEAVIATLNDELNAISNKINIVYYFANTPDLLKELRCYWIEGDYSNDNIAVDDDTSLEDEIDLAEQLLESAEVELKKVCQPHYSFSLEAVDLTKNYEFEEQMKDIELGKIITIEKEEGLWYYPALLELSMSLDSTDSFSMTFTNGLRLDDWSYKYGDLISQSSSTSRTVSSNWSDLTSYSKVKTELSALIKEPLSTTLRASFMNTTNQEFKIDETGILGRKFTNESKTAFEDEQMRILNNIIIFTDDGWDTAKTALGKIYYTDDDGNQITAYGLIGETIIGSLMMTEKLKVVNDDKSVVIDKSGISILNGGQAVLQAKNDGTITISNYVSAGDLKDELSLYVTSSSLTTTLSSYVTDTKLSKQLKAYVTSSALDVTLSSYITADTLDSKLSIYATSEQLTAKADSVCGDSTSTFGWTLTSSGFKVFQNAKTIMDITSAGATIAGWKITDSYFSSEVKGRGYLFIYSASNDGDDWIQAQASNGKETFGISKDGILTATGAVLSEATISGGINGELKDGITVGTDGSCKLNSYTGAGTNKGCTLAFDDSTYLRLGSQSSGSEVWLSSGHFITIGNATSPSSLNVTVASQYIHLGDKNLTVKTVGYLYGNWYHKDSDSTYVISDATKKNSINTISPLYDSMFDSLRPVTFKYNDGTSNRTHIGFIAQEVLSAVESASLTSQDFGGYAYHIDEETSEGSCYLRYDEFIALNTWQIQKLKNQITVLSSKITSLEAALEAK